MTRLLRKRGGFYCDLEELSLHLLEDIRAYKRNDPAARSAIEVVLLYNGLHATIDYRIAHWFYRHRCFFIARAISQLKFTPARRSAAVWSLTTAPGS